MIYDIEKIVKDNDIIYIYTDRESHSKNVIDIECYYILFRDEPYFFIDIFNSLDNEDNLVSSKLVMTNDDNETIILNHKQEEMIRNSVSKIEK
ncbi:hypothetical protein BCT92_22055 [Vibrio sp. 10N.261.52.E5]|nr:hypothetical protein BCT92_22055 [Vibrio sp. 10N.261.52.E5]